MKVKVQKHCINNLEKLHIKSKIKKCIEDILKLIGTSLHGITECIGIICMVFFFIGTNPDTGEHVFIQVWNANIQRNGIVSTLSFIALLLMIGYIFEKALKDL